MTFLSSLGSFQNSDNLFLEPPIPLKPNAEAEAAEYPVDVHAEPDSVEGKMCVLREFVEKIF